MLTNFVIFDDAGSAIHKGVGNLEVTQRRDGLHVVGKFSFKARVKVSIERCEVDLGNRVWIQDDPSRPTLAPGDIYNVNLDMHLTDTAG